MRNWNDEASIAELQMIACFLSELSSVDAKKILRVKDYLFSDELRLEMFDVMKDLFSESLKPVNPADVIQRMTIGSVLERETQIKAIVQSEWFAEPINFEQRYAALSKAYAKRTGRTAPDLTPILLKSLSSFEERAPDFLVPGYIPRNALTLLCGDGGTGKTTAWCSLVADLSNGKMPRIFQNALPEQWAGISPQRIAIFSQEDSVETTLKRRLRLNGANQENISTLSMEDEKLQDIKFNSAALEAVLESGQIDVCVFDPLQAFVDPNIKMSERNAMRNALQPLIRCCERYEVTALITMHSNKRQGAWGRNRMADSADIWDIARSVLMVGNTGEDVRYISHEKSNYGPLEDTALFSIQNEVVYFEGTTSKKDRDFALETAQFGRPAPKMQEAVNFIENYLQSGQQREVKELDLAAKAAGITDHTLRRAKETLRAEGKITTLMSGFGKDKKHIISMKHISNGQVS